MGHYSRQGSLLEAEGNPNEKMHLWGTERGTIRYFWPGGHKMWWDWKRDHSIGVNLQIPVIRGKSPRIYLLNWDN